MTREQISGTGQTLMQAIEESVTKQLAPDTIRLLYTEFRDHNRQFSVFSSSSAGTGYFIDAILMQKEVWQAS